MKQMAESNNYLILNEYEKVFLKLKATSQLILIGEFYGDPDVALISDDETYCAVGGEGVIYNVPLVKTQMKKIIVTAKTLYSHPKNVSKIYAALHTDLAW